MNYQIDEDLLKITLKKNETKIRKQSNAITNQNYSKFDLWNNGTKS